MLVEEWKFGVGVSYDGIVDLTWEYRQKGIGGSGMSSIGDKRWSGLRDGVW